MASEWLWNEARRAVTAAWPEWLRDAGPRWLYFRRGELCLAEECPEGFQLGDAQALRGDRTADQCVAWIHDKARRLPCLPETNETVAA